MFILFLALASPAETAQQLEKSSSALARASPEVLMKSQLKGQAIALLYPQNQSQILLGSAASEDAFGLCDLYDS